MKTNPQEELPIQVSVVIPVYNGADTIVELITRLEKVLSENFDDYEIIMVEDRSPDDSWSSYRRCVLQTDGSEGFS